MADGDRIARVARALCVADGRDPETEIVVRTDVVDDGNGVELHYEVSAPAWTSYAEEARGMVSAVRALGLLE